MEHDILFGNSNRENGTTFLDFPLFLGICQWDEPTKRVPFTAEPEIPEILTKWKAPLFSGWDKKDYHTLGEGGSIALDESLGGEGKRHFTISYGPSLFPWDLCLRLGCSSICKTRPEYQMFELILQ